MESLIKHKFDENYLEGYRFCSGGGGGGGGGQSRNRPGITTWGRPLADYTYDIGNFSPGIEARNNFLNPNDIFPMIQNLLGNAQQGGQVQRAIASDLTNQAIPGMQNIAGQSMAGTQGIGYMNSLVPGLFGAATDFAGNVNQAENQGFNPAMGAAGQTLQNVMNPTFYNPLFQNAARNITPQINADFSSKGLGSSGASSAALDSAYSNLADKFAERQVQEQLGAQQGLGNLANAFGNQGIQAAQLPGQIYNQMQQGQLIGQQGLGMAGQNQLLPLQGLSAGSEQYWQGVNNPMNVFSGGYQIGSDPLKNAVGAVGTAMGNVGMSGTPIWQTIMGKLTGK